MDGGRKVFEKMNYLIEELVRRQNLTVRGQDWDTNHERLTKNVVDQFAPLIPKGKVVDVGCGKGLARKHWVRHGFDWVGVTIGPDWEYMKHKECVRGDMHILSRIVDADVVYARHVLEHSPMPVVALRRWMDISTRIIVVVPKPTPRAIDDTAHLSVLPRVNWIKYFNFLGLRIALQSEVEYSNPAPWPQTGGEFRFLLSHNQKKLFCRR